MKDNIMYFIMRNIKVAIIFIFILILIRQDFLLYRVGKTSILVDNQDEICPVIKLYELEISNVDKKINTDKFKQEQSSKVTNNIESEPIVKSDSLESINGVISTYSNFYNDDGSQRIDNMRLAIKLINGTIVMPGEEFSYNNTIGETVAERGYKEANVYIGGKVEPQYGGGVCQISTSLYRAMMRANIRSTKRFNHSMMVGYSEPSLDATVYDNDIDYRFINTYDTPIYIEGYINNSIITFNIYGNVEAMEGRTYDLENEIIKEYPFEVEEREDSELEQGKTLVEVKGIKGYKSKGYLVTYENGVEISKELISVDVYSPLNERIAIGSKK